MRLELKANVPSVLGSSLGYVKFPSVNENEWSACITINNSRSFCPKKIKENLNKLRELRIRGNLTASLALACIVFSGDLMGFDRIRLTDFLKEKLSEEAFHAKNKDGETILHVLANYIAERGIYCSHFSLGLMSFICKTAAYLLDEEDNFGIMAYKKIRRVIKKLSDHHQETGNKLAAIIADYAPQSLEPNYLSYTL